MNMMKDTLNPGQSTFGPSTSWRRNVVSSFSTISNSLHCCSDSGLDSEEDDNDDEDDKDSDNNNKGCSHQ
jgi:hypothetical protein